VIDKLSGEGFFMLKKVAGTDARSQGWNKQVDAVHDQIDTFFKSGDPRMAAEAFVRGASAQVLLGANKAMETEIGRLRGQLSALGHAEAGISPAGGDKPGGAKPAIPADLSPEAAAKLIMG